MNGWRSGEIYIYIFLLLFSCQVVSDSVTPWTAARQASLSLTISWSLPQFMSVASMMPSSHLILWHPLFPPPSIFASIRDFSNELAIRIRWPSNHFTLSINPSSDYSGLISLRIDWFDLLDVQETPKGLFHTTTILILAFSNDPLPSLSSCLWTPIVLSLTCFYHHYQDETSQREKY